MTKLLIVAVALTAGACSGTVQAFSPAGASPVSQESGKRSIQGGACTVTLSTEVKGYPHDTVAVASVTGCNPADTSWALTTNPDGVVYHVYADSDKLYADQPSANGRGAYLKLVDFIATNPVCVEATAQSATARIGLLGVTCPR